MFVVTSRYKIFLQQFMIIELVKKLSGLKEQNVHQRVYKSLQLSWASWIRWTASNPISVRLILISSSYVPLCIPNGFFSCIFPLKFYIISCFPNTGYMLLSRHPFRLLSLTILCIEKEMRSFLVCNFLIFPITFPFWDPSTLLITLF